MFSLALEADASLVLGVTSSFAGLGCWLSTLEGSSENRRKPELNMDLETDFLTPHSRKRGLVPGCGHSETGIQALSAPLNSDQLLSEAFLEQLMPSSCFFHVFAHLLSPGKS